MTGRSVTGDLVSMTMSRTDLPDRGSSDETASISFSVSATHKYRSTSHNIVIDLHLSPHKSSALSACALGLRSLELLLARSNGWSTPRTNPCAEGGAANVEPIGLSMTSVCDDDVLDALTSVSVGGTESRLLAGSSTSFSGAGGRRMYASRSDWVGEGRQSGLSVNAWT